MNYRQIQREEYEAYIPWFINRTWTKPPTHNIFSDHGIVCMMGDTPAACLWIYLNGSGLAHFDWIASNPELEKFDQDRCVLNLIEYVQREICPNLEPKINLLVCNLANIEIAYDMKRLGFYSKRGLIQMTWRRPESELENQTP